MSRGPAPTPTAILASRGSRRAAARKDEPAPDATVPAPPKWLTRQERTTWRTVAKRLLAMRVLDSIDGFALSRYCRLWTRWSEAADWIKKNGEVYIPSDANGSPGKPAAWPQVAIVQRLEEQMRRLEAEFGMTPAGRARVKVSPKKKVGRPLSPILKMGS